MFRQADRREVYGVFALLLLSAVLVMLQNFSLERSFVLDGRGKLSATILDDQAFNGSSVGYFRQSEKGLEFNCDINPGDFEWPYCEIAINVAKVGEAGLTQGVDLSLYDRVGLWVRYKNAKQGGIRFQVHNFNPLYSVPGERETLKFNAVEYHEKYSAYPTWINLNRFQVPTWWLSRNNLSLDDVGTDFSNVLSMSFVTGSHVPPGFYEMVIDRVEFRGKIFDSATVYIALICVWALAAIGFVYQRFVTSRRDLARAKVQQKEWEKKATEDPLTGAVNRIGAHKVFARQLYSINRHTDFSVIFMDIDHFKRINDSHGHAVGDDVLKRFVKVIGRNTRDSDTLARWGGEEFILICTNTTLSPAVRLAEKLRAAVQAESWPEGMEITCSFGVAQMSEEPIEKFIERADKALYSAKGSGRNCVVSAA